MLRVVKFSSEIQHELAACDVPLTIIWNDGWLVRFCQRPLATCESMIRLEANLAGVVCIRGTPCANELRLWRALASDEQRRAAEGECGDAL